MRLLITLSFIFIFAPDVGAESSLEAHLVEVTEKELSFDIDELKWSDYKTDSCQVLDTSVANENTLRAKGLRRCRDRSISFVQPSSDGAGGWEGKCGQTFGANSLFMYCRVAVDPATYFSRYFRDITPGVRPATLRRGMNKISKKFENDCFSSSQIWKTFYSRNESQFIAKVESLLEARYSLPRQTEIHRNGNIYINNPVGALIQNPGGNYLHWVTIVDVLKTNNSCKFVINHWDNQYQVPCSTFASWSRNVGKTYPIILKSYSLITYK